MTMQHSEEIPHPLKKIWPVMQEFEDSDSGFKEKLSPLDGRI